MKALVVDDQSNVRLLLARILRTRTGCDVREAANGVEALALLEREPMDVVLLDVMMPLMDGIETLEAIRRTPSLRHLPVIVLSAVRDEVRVRQLVRHGIAAYLAKPLRPLDVAERIRAILDRLTTGTDAPRPACDRATAAAPDVPALRADLRPHVIAATEQVFGMLLGIDVQAAGVHRPPGLGDDVARVALHFDRAPWPLEFGITAPRAMTERMTARYLQGADVVADADVSSTLAGVAMIIGNRLQAALRARGDAVTLAEPVVSVLGQQEDGESAGLWVGFASPAQDLRFMTTLRAVPVAGRAPAAAPASRIARMDTPMPPAVDAEVLEMLASLQEPGEPDLVVELVTLFLRDTPERLRDLRARPLEAAPTARVAHSVKGSAGNLGASHLQDLASRLEQASQQGAPGEELGRLADAVCTEYARVERHLRGVLTARAGADAGAARG